MVSLRNEARTTCLWTPHSIMPEAGWVLAKVFVRCYYVVDCKYYRALACDTLIAL